MTDVFINGIGTVRECRHCGALVTGGTTACMHCTKTYVRVANAIERTLAGAFWRFYHGRGRKRFRRAVDAIQKRLARVKP